MALNWCICGSKLGLRKVMIKNKDYLCYDCVKAAGFNPVMSIFVCKLPSGISRIKRPASSPVPLQ